MVFKEQKRQKWSFDREFKGRKNNFVASVHWSDFNKRWWFLIKYPDDKVYNSLWDDGSYNTQDECEKAAETYVDMH